MSFRTRRRKVTKKIFMETGAFVKVRIVPWVRTTNGCVWLASLAVSKSNRQVNDWLKKRKNKRVRRMDMNLTGKHGNKSQAIAVKILREMPFWIPKGDSFFFLCESAKADKQFRVWKKWFSRWEDLRWVPDEENKGFFFYNNRY